ncbi:hypothetical protein E5288_WYG002193 [Bos mutus]|uniref:SRCR domain-containing protein n=1 Tax=Bos mutus TaxID=72004 RepID=A0A6B0SEZ6_9CETA|nr:hypothetical protein [Bos mutus]
MVLKAKVISSSLDQVKLRCGVAISTPKGAEGNDQLWKAQYHCLGNESFLWEYAVTALGGPDCSHGNMASVICSGNQAQVLPQSNDSRSEPAGSAASEESAPYCSGSRQFRLVDGGSHCAGRAEILDQGSWDTICDDGWDLGDTHVVCSLIEGCGEALNAMGSAHFGAGSGPIWLDNLNCTRKESHVWRCPSWGWGQHYCRHRRMWGSSAQSEFLALRMVNEDQQCAGRLEVFYNGTWGSVCCSPVEDITLSVICREPGCGDSGTLNSSVALRKGSRPRWVDGIRCQKTDTSLWQCPSDPWKYSSCSPKEEAYISCAGRRPKSCPTAAPCTGARTTLPLSTAGTRTTSNPLPGIFSLPGVLCLILGALLFLVFVILVTQLLRWRAERRALSSYEDALAEAMYEELDDLATRKECLLGSPAPDQRTDAPGEDYNDAEEVPVPGAPPASQGSEEEVLPKKEDGMRSQTDSSLNVFREEADPGEGEESPGCSRGRKGTLDTMMLNSVPLELAE